VLALVVVVAAGLRIHGYTTYPALKGWPDELAWSGSGLTLITDHYPSGYSALAAYPHRETVVFAGMALPVVKPWLDNPPLFSLLIGGSAWLGGARHITEVSPAWDRAPPILLSLVSLVLLYVIGRRLASHAEALLAVIALAVSPAAVAFARQPVSEALLAPMILLLLITLERHVTQPAGWSRWLGVALGLCLVAPLVKVPGIALAGVAAPILTLRGRWRAALACACAGIIGLAVFVAYGLALDWSTFLAVQREQAGRLLGASGAFDFFVGPSYYALPIDSQNVVHDGWWILGLIGLGALVLEGEQRLAEFVAWPVVIYGTTILLLGSGHVFTYYHLAVYPLAYLAAASLAVRTANRLSLPGLGLVIGLAAAATRVPGLASSAMPWLIACVILVVVASAVVAIRKGGTTSTSIARMTAWGALGAVIAGSLVTSATLASGPL
jgi:4-amino-4-deoxy-L-arabinose transferase-like glycosyltransferase